MKEWQRKQAHYDAVRETLKETGSLDKKGQIRRWRGGIFWPKLKARGHTRMAYGECACRSVS